MQPHVYKLEFPPGQTTQQFTEWMHDKMLLNGWNYAEFARKAGVTQSMVSRWKDGSQPSPEILRRVAARLGEDFDDLLFMAGYRKRPPSADPPRHAELIAKLRQVDLTRDRYLALLSIIETWRSEPPKTLDGGWLTDSADGHEQVGGTEESAKPPQHAATSKATTGPV